MNRRKSREIAMKLVYEMLIKKDGYEEIFEDFKEHTEIDLADVDMEYIKRILSGIYESSSTIDETIEKYLVNWKLERLSRIDIAILRLAIYEITNEEDIPDVVSVNEAVELAKKYSQDVTGAFINGVLGKLIEK